MDTVRPEALEAFLHACVYREVAQEGQGVLGGAVVVVRSGAQPLEVAKTFGIEDYGSFKPVSAGTWLGLGPCSRLLVACTAMAVMQELGLDLDTDVNSLLPPDAQVVPCGGSGPRVAITVRMLLTHTSGVVRGSLDVPHADDDDKRLDDQGRPVAGQALAGVALGVPGLDERFDAHEGPSSPQQDTAVMHYLKLFGVSHSGAPSGTAAAYRPSGVDLVLLAAVVEHLTGRPYPAAARLLLQAIDVTAAGGPPPPPPSLPSPSSHDGDTAALRAGAAAAGGAGAAMAPCLSPLAGLRLTAGSIARLLTALLDAGTGASLSAALGTATGAAGMAGTGVAGPGDRSDAGSTPSSRRGSSDGPRRSSSGVGGGGRSAGDAADLHSGRAGAGAGAPRAAACTSWPHGLLQQLFKPWHVDAGLEQSLGCIGMTSTGVAHTAVGSVLVLQGSEVPTSSAAGYNAGDDTYDAHEAGIVGGSHAVLAVATDAAVAICIAVRTAGRGTQGAARFCSKVLHDVLMAFRPADQPLPSLRSWVTNLQPVRAEAAVHLVCFPYAGAPAATGGYGAWPLVLPTFIRVRCVHLPGRGARRQEAHALRLSRIAAAAAAAIAATTPAAMPLALFGHGSIGALTALETARALEGLYRRPLLHVFVSGCVAPCHWPSNANPDVRYSPWLHSNATPESPPRKAAANAATRRTSRSSSTNSRTGGVARSSSNNDRSAPHGGKGAGRRSNNSSGSGTLPPLGCAVYELPDEQLLALLLKPAPRCPRAWLAAHDGQRPPATSQDQLVALRADLEAEETYRHVPPEQPLTPSVAQALLNVQSKSQSESRMRSAQLSCPLTVCRGKDDPSLAPAAGTSSGGTSPLDAWAEMTKGPVQQWMFAGDHFYLEDLGTAAAAAGSGGSSTAVAGGMALLTALTQELGRQLSVHATWVPPAQHQPAKRPGATGNVFRA